ncbi:MAG: site-2 protease family protein [Cytophagales bacterium]|nr:site-2 protease family protein [Cytophagales bacterium]
MPQRNANKYLVHLLLFAITLVSTTLAGAEWMTGRSFLFSSEIFGIRALGWPDFRRGLLFSVPFLAFLTVHEFGHYFTAQWHKLKASLPYYIPLWLGWLGGPSLGTMGAFIRIKNPFRTRGQVFDVGISGPLAGFAVALGVLWYGFTHLPPKEYIFKIHPEYAQYGADYEKYAYTYQHARQQDSLRFIALLQNARAEGLIPKDSVILHQPLSREAFEAERSLSVALGTNLLMELFARYVAPDPTLVPNGNELGHYPFLLAGFLALLFTGLNLIPIGQLDGGHILYGMIGERWSSVLSPVLFVAFVFYAGLGAVNWKGEMNLTGEPLPPYTSIPLYIGILYVIFSRMFDNPLNVLVLSTAVLAGQLITSSLFGLEGYPGWLVFAFVLGRFLGVYHPPAALDEPLSPARKALGWFSLLVFILCFTPQPFVAG